jgi:hypothetical protein
LDKVKIMELERRHFLKGLATLAVLAGTGGVQAQAAGRDEVAHQVLATWYRLALELVRHTPIMSPPVTSRALAYMGIGCFEALASGDPALVSLQGQLHDMPALPDRAPGQGHDTAVILNAVLDPMIHAFFRNTGPTGQHALETLTAKLATQAATGVPDDVVAASRSYGTTLARAILAWAATDGGADIENMGFPRHWTLNPAPGHWVPTSKIVQQQAPLLPDWGRNRPFALPAADACTIADPTPYSEAKDSAFWAEAMEVYDTVRTLTEERSQIARFWSDDPMLSYTPAGHWTAIMNQVAEEKGLDLTAHVEALARTGIAMADAFIGCWEAKYRFDLVRPVTYINAHIDPAWQPILITPPFPEYPSGHSVQSAAAATLLTHLFGEDYSFVDESPTPDGVEPRQFASFWAAANEAAISRLYGGIHFRPAIEHGQNLGRAIAAYAVALKTRA